MAGFEVTPEATLALIVTYEVLRSQQGCGLASVSCLLLESSALLFGFTTRMVFSDMPYFFASMLVLWVLLRLDSTGCRGWKRTAWWVFCAVLLPATVLMRSTGIAFLGGMLAWLAVSLW